MKKQHDVFISEEFAKSAMRHVFSIYDLGEVGFKQIAPEEYVCNTDHYEFKVRHLHNGATALTARFCRTGKLSMVCLLKPSINQHGEILSRIERKLEPYELRRLPDYII